MRPRVALRATVLLLALIALPLAAVRATHSPTVQSVLNVAAAYQMSCEGTASEVFCDAYDFDGTWRTHATIKPGSPSSPLTSLYTFAVVRFAPLDPYFQGWLYDMHLPACAPNRTAGGQLSSFVSSVGNLQSAGTVNPMTIPGECDLTGGMNIVINQSGQREFNYWINAFVIVPPPPTPVPTPVPTPAPTPPPTPPPTASPTSAPTATPRPSASAAATVTPSPSASATPSETATTSPTSTPSTSPTRTPRPSATASPTPEQTVAGITFAPEPSAAAPDVAEDSIPWAASVHGPADVSTDPAALGASAAAAMLLLLFMGFVGELFNNTVKANYDELIGLWQKSWPGRLTAAWARLWRPRP
jgi:hypothetical protein